MLSLIKCGNGTGCNRNSIEYMMYVETRVLLVALKRLCGFMKPWGKYLEKLPRIWLKDVRVLAILLIPRQPDPCPRLYWAVFSTSRNYRFFGGNFGHNIKSAGDKICGQWRLLLTDGKLLQRALHQCKPFSLNKAALSKKFYRTNNNWICMPFLPLEAGYRQNIHVLYCPQIFEEKTSWPKNGVAWLKRARRRLGQKNVKQAVD